MGAVTGVVVAVAVAAVVIVAAEAVVASSRQVRVDTVEVAEATVVEAVVPCYLRYIKQAFHVLVVNPLSMV